MRCCLRRCILLDVFAVAAAQERGERLREVPFTDVAIGDAFWAPRFDTNRTKSLPHNFQWCERDGANRQFLQAAGGWTASSSAFASTIPTCTRSSRGRPIRSPVAPSLRWRKPSMK